MLTVDLTKNEKQAQLYEVTMREAAIHKEIEAKKERGELPQDYVSKIRVRYIFYGGAIRGGKTFGIFFMLVLLCRLFPGSRWHVIRRSYPDLLKSSIPSMEKILKGVPVRWNRSTSNYFVEFKNGSRVYFISENLARDPELKSFLGLESNGFVCEQAEELSEKTFERCKERAGSWYDTEPCVPPPLIFLSFNPTYGWLKDIRDKAVAGELQLPYVFMTALPSDNKLVTAEQWAQWGDLDPESYARMIEGSWDIKVEGRFLYTFQEKLHVKAMPYVEDLPVYMSIDFNVDPMTCILFQAASSGYFHVFKEFRIPDSDTYELCAQVKEYVIVHNMHSRLYVTGDASGMNRMSGARKHINQYEIIRTELGIPGHRFQVPSANPFLTDSRTFCNSAVHSLPSFSIDPSCEHLIKDLLFVVITRDQEGKVKIQKSGKNPYAGVDNSLLGHLLDCLRYGMHTTLSSWIRIPKS